MTPVKRGRGRPPKGSPVTSPSPATTPKRGRGRPRTLVKDEEEEDEEPTIAVIVKEEDLKEEDAAIPQTRRYAYSQDLKKLSLYQSIYML